VYLTWSREDAVHSMAIRWLTRRPGPASRVYYDRRPRGGDPSAYAYQSRGDDSAVPGVARRVHAAELTRLAADTPYWFVVGDAENGYSAERSFRTPPGDDGPLDFVAGGDVSTGLLPGMLSRQAAARRPSFALLAGDLAYAEGDSARFGRWERWLEEWDRTMRTPEGHSIPLLAALGDHDVDSSAPVGSGRRMAPYYFALLQQDPHQRTHFLRRFGRIAVWVLDSGHVAGHRGDQKEWLAATLRAARDVPVKVAVYHRGLYPAHHDPDDALSRAGRAHWAPLFDAYRLTAAFEGHGHLHKRTHPLRGGRRVRPGQGTLYLGDGAWGKSSVKRPQPGRWYLARALRRRHVWWASLSGGRLAVEALGATGRRLDVSSVPLGSPRE
jgi:hypothetical protein